eukprot:CAMPEP_0194282154 /NCGR_PEP_ID=MMETSP0169-20130528/22501_1 /TAXON_ID=218684 /ORGANISM="Corethron pennatum, Strain L29A3" /LENGTH=379 /DNA_ID=CAMNT_0039027401 /DNA_START=171 /DNA_END=1310 /DNA_ORIENTATION=-
MVHFFKFISASVLYGIHLGSASIELGNDYETIDMRSVGGLREMRSVRGPRGRPAVESGNAAAPKKTKWDRSNGIFLRSIFLKAVDTASENVALSPVGIYFISSMTMNLLKGDLKENWSSVGSKIDLKTFNNKLVGDPLVNSKSVIAGTYVNTVPPDFTMENFEMFDSVDVNAIGEFLETDVSEIQSAIGVAVHVLDFEGNWETKFSQKQVVTFSDDLNYMFMQARIPNVPYYSNKKVEMITLPFSGSETSGDSVVIDFIKSKLVSDKVNLEHHPTWVTNSKVVTDNTDVAIPKIDIEYGQELDLSYETNVKYLQKVAVKWDEDGVTAQAVTMRMSRSFDWTPSFVADRPFYFIIRKGDLWLFTGYVNSIDENLNPISPL